MWETEETTEPLMRDRPRGPQTKVRQDWVLLPGPFIDSLCHPWPPFLAFDDECPDTAVI